MEDRYKLSDLKQQVKEEVKEWIKAEDPEKLHKVLEAENFHDTAHEIADSITPISSYDILLFGAYNLSEIGYYEVESPAFDGEMNPVNVTAAAIFDTLEEYAMEEIGRQLRDKVEESVTN